MKKVLFPAALLLSMGLRAQVGINESNPQATLEIKSKSGNTDNKIEGLLIPRVSKKKAYLMAKNGNKLKESTLVYVDNLDDYTGTPADVVVAEVTEKGYYYYNGAKWVKSTGVVEATNGLTKTGNQIKLGGELTETTRVDTNGRNLLLSGSGKIGIGTDAPKSRIDIEGDNWITSSIRLKRKDRKYVSAGILLTKENGEEGTGGKVDNGESLGAILFGGNNGAAEVNGALISAAAEGAVESGKVLPTRLEFGTFSEGVSDAVGTPTTRMVINSQGNVGIGTSAPVTDLHINKNTKDVVLRAESSQDKGSGWIQLGAKNSGLSIGFTKQEGKGYINYDNAFGSATLNLITFANGGNVGIGTLSPSEKLEVAGKIKTNAVIYNSDARLKKEVTNLEGADALLAKVRPVTYYWNDLGKERGGDAKLQYGFIAQEVEKVLPNLVSTDTEGYKAVNYVAVIPVLVKALQEKDAELKELKAEVEAIKALLNKKK